MIFKKLASLFKPAKEVVTSPDTPDKLSREFASLAQSLESVLGEELVESLIMDFHHNEVSIAIRSLVNTIIDLEPSLTEEQQDRIAAFAEMEDQFREQKWQRSQKEMTPEQLVNHGIKQPQSLLAEFREVYPKPVLRGK